MAAHMMEDMENNLQLNIVYDYGDPLHSAGIVQWLLFLFSGMKWELECTFQ